MDKRTEMPATETSPVYFQVLPGVLLFCSREATGVFLWLMEVEELLRRAEEEGLPKVGG